MMLFRETPLAGAYVVEAEPMEDERGFFARMWCEREFRERGLCDRFVQCNLSYNRRRGTLRGMHYQADPHGEIKLVRCVRGSIHDVIVDLRPDSPTFTSYFAVRLSARPLRMLYIPEGLAHGFLTLEDDTEVFYQMSEFYHPESARGVRWNDPAFGVVWPEEVRVISDRDRSYPDFRVDAVRRRRGRGGS